MKTKTKEKYNEILNFILYLHCAQLSFLSYRCWVIHFAVTPCFVRFYSISFALYLSLFCHTVTSYVIVKNCMANIFLFIVWYTCSFLFFLNFCLISQSIVDCAQFSYNFIACVLHNMFFSAAIVFVIYAVFTSCLLCFRCFSFFSHLFSSFSTHIFSYAAHYLSHFLSFNGFFRLALWFLCAISFNIIYIFDAVYCCIRLCK